MWQLPVMHWTSRYRDILVCVKIMILRCLCNQNVHCYFLNFNIVFMDRLWIRPLHACRDNRVFQKVFILLDELNKKWILVKAEYEPIISWSLSNFCSHYTTESTVLVESFKLHLLRASDVLSNSSNSSNWTKMSLFPQKTSMLRLRMSECQEVISRVTALVMQLCTFWRQ